MAKTLAENDALKQAMRLLENAQRRKDLKLKPKQSHWDRIRTSSKISKLDEKLDRKWQPRPCEPRFTDGRLAVCPRCLGACSFDEGAVLNACCMRSTWEMLTSAEWRTRKQAAWDARLRALNGAPPPKRTRVVAKARPVPPSFAELSAMFDALMERGIYDFEPWILFFYGKGPDPDVKP